MSATAPQDPSSSSRAHLAPDADPRQRHGPRAFQIESHEVASGRDHQGQPLTDPLISGTPGAAWAARAATVIAANGGVGGLFTCETSTDPPRQRPRPAPDVLEQQDRHRSCNKDTAADGVADGYGVLLQRLGTQQQRAAIPPRSVSERSLPGTPDRLRRRRLTHRPTSTRSDRLRKTTELPRNYSDGKQTTVGRRRRRLPAPSPTWSLDLTGDPTTAC